MTASEHSPDASPTEVKIEMNLSRLAQLFNSLDPAPFHERDLDADAEEYIISSVRRNLAPAAIATRDPFVC